MLAIRMTQESAGSQTQQTETVNNKSSLFVPHCNQCPQSGFCSTCWAQFVRLQRDDEDEKSDPVSRNRNYKRNVVDLTCLSDEDASHGKDELSPTFPRRRKRKRSLQERGTEMTEEWNAKKAKVNVDCNAQRNNKGQNGETPRIPLVHPIRNTDNKNNGVIGKESKKDQNGNFKKWNCHDTLAWLYTIGFEEYVPIIGNTWIEDDIDGETLQHLDHDDLKRMGINKLLHRKMLLMKVDSLANK